MRALFSVCSLLHLSNLLCAHGDQPLQSAASGSLDSRCMEPMTVLAGAQTARGERDWSVYSLTAPPTPTRPWARATFFCLRSQLLSGGLFPTAPDCLTPSPCPPGLNVAMASHSCKYHSSLSKTSLC